MRPPHIFGGIFSSWPLNLCGVMNGFFFGARRCGYEIEMCIDGINVFPECVFICYKSRLCGRRHHIANELLLESENELCEKTKFGN